MKFKLFFKDGMLKEQNLEQHIIAWQKCMSDLKRKGVLESGNMIANKSVKDRKPSKVKIIGYIVVDVASKNEAIDVVKQSSRLPLGGSTVIETCMAM